MDCGAPLASETAMTSTRYYSSVTYFWRSISRARTRAYLFSDSRVTAHDHLCLVYETEEEQLAGSIPYLRAGLEAHERCLYIVDEETAETARQALTGRGIDVAAAVQTGALYFLTRKSSYLRDGYFCA